VEGATPVAGLGGIKKPALNVEGGWNLRIIDTKVDVLGDRRSFSLSEGISE